MKIKQKFDIIKLALFFGIFCFVFFVPSLSVNAGPPSKSKFYDYKCNYSNYLNHREEELIQQIAAKKNQEKFVQHTQQLINKFRAKKNKASFAQSLIKKLDNLD